MNSNYTFLRKDSEDIIHISVDVNMSTKHVKRFNYRYKGANDSQIATACENINKIHPTAVFVESFVRNESEGVDKNVSEQIKKVFEKGKAFEEKRREEHRKEKGQYHDFVKFPSLHVVKEPE